MSRVFPYAVAGVVMLAVAASAGEPTPKTTEETAVVCDACSARKKGLLKLKDAREAEEKTGEEAANLSTQDEPAEQ